MAMTTTHILVDFENVQPTAADISLARGDGVRLAIFRGPGQKKYSADVAEARVVGRRPLPAPVAADGQPGEAGLQAEVERSRPQEDVKLLGAAG